MGVTESENQISRKRPNLVCELFVINAKGKVHVRWKNGDRLLIRVMLVFLHSQLDRQGPVYIYRLSWPRALRCHWAL